MPLKVNGITIPWTFIVPTALGLLWLGGLSWQVTANADDLERVEGLSTDIALIKQDQKYLKDAVRAIAKALNVEVVASTTISNEQVDNTSEEDGSSEN